MRSESEVLQSLMSWALYDDNVRTIVLDGSRADPSRTIDDFSDFDVIVIVSDPGPIRTETWIHKFGEPMVRWPLQPQSTFDDAWITQLVLYTDGVRVDFQFTTPDIARFERPGPFHCVLVDKERLTEQIAGEPVAGTTIDPPSAEEFADRINSFWWDIPYVAKALRRNELDYARFIMEGDIRWHKLQPLIRWHIGAVHGSQTDVGVFCRWSRRYLDPDIWELYLETFSGAAIEDQWRAMFAMCSFVRLLGQDSAGRYGFEYPEVVDQQVFRYLRYLSPPSQEIP
jgi:aminoglycoside 6-adenylyltransferase